MLINMYIHTQVEVAAAAVEVGVGNTASVSALL
jgi:hypothetical protein